MIPSSMTPGFLSSAVRFRAAVPFVAVWSVVAVGLALLDARPDHGLGDVAFAAAVGAAVGLGSAWFELTALPGWGRRLSPWTTALARTAFHAVVVVVLVVGLAGAGWAVRSVFGTGALEVYGPAETGLYVRSASFFAVVGGTAAASLVLNVARQVHLVLGPGTFTALMTGRYRTPVREHRAFLFLDLTGSTAAAQRLGPALFNDFKNDFFADVAGPVLASRGRIYQYVGDEVVVTWRVRDGRTEQSPVEAFALLEAVIAHNADRYRARYGEVPTFKGGLHAGEVVTAEVGTIKKDLVYSGDAVNVTARIEGACHEFGARLLASEAGLALAPLPAGVTAEDVGEVSLRGREGAVRLFRVTTSPARAAG